MARLSCRVDVAIARDRMLSMSRSSLEDTAPSVYRLRHQRDVRLPPDG